MGTAVESKNVLLDGDHINKIEQIREYLTANPKRQWGDLDDGRIIFLALCACLNQLKETYDAKIKGGEWNEDQEQT